MPGARGLIYVHAWRPEISAECWRPETPHAKGERTRTRYLLMTLPGCTLCNRPHAVAILYIHTDKTSLTADKEVVGGDLKVSKLTH